MYSFVLIAVAHKSWLPLQKAFFVREIISLLYCKENEQGCSALIVTLVKLTIEFVNWLDKLLKRTFHFQKVTFLVSN